MSDMNYGISVEFKKGLEALKSFKKASDAFNKSQESALQRQITLAEKLKRVLGSTPSSPREPSPRNPPKPREPSPRNPPKPTSSFVGPQIDNNTKAMLKKREDLDRKLTKDITKLYEDEEKNRTKIAVAEAKRRNKLVQAEQSGRRRQAVAGITAPTGAGDMRSFYKDQEKSANKVAAVEKRRAASLEKAKENIRNMAIMSEKTKNLTVQELDTRRKIEKILKDSKDLSTLRQKMNIHRKTTREIKKQNFLMDRMEASSKNFAGNMVSAFAVAGATTMVTQTGQAFEAVDNTMLAVSGNSKDAGENLAFVKEEAMRLGVGFKESAKQYAKMVAAQGDMTDNDLQENFRGLAEMSTVLGLSADESGRAFTALTQIMSKGQVMAEELKGQLGEVMPNALQIMAKSAKDAGLETDGSVKSLMKLMEQGKVMANDVMPHFAKRMREAASGGLAKAMDSNRVAMGRMTNSIEIAANAFFKSGYSEGLTDLFNSIADFFSKNEHTWKAFGKIVGGVLKGLAFVLEEVITPIFSAIGSILHTVTEVLGSMSGALALLAARFGVTGKAVSYLWNVLSGGKGVLGGLAGMFKKLLTPILLVVGALEEVAEFLAPTGKKTLIGTNINELGKNLGDVLGAVISPVGTLVDKLEGAVAVRDKGAPTAGGYLRGNSAGISGGGSNYGGAKELKQTIVMPIYLSGDKIAENISNNQIALDTIDRRVNEITSGNY
ncbi:coil containing protein [Vibrio phage 1.121.O._10N.286.46.C4]|nr:coil containing protein [Vibrio phage 1.121.O._10N.286.46.C4]